MAKTSKKQKKPRKRDLTHLCHCDRCGGPEGPGIPRNYSTFARHQAKMKKKEDRAAQRQLRGRQNNAQAGSSTQTPNFERQASTSNSTTSSEEQSPKQTDDEKNAPGSPQGLDSPMSIDSATYQFGSPAPDDHPDPGSLRDLRDEQVDLSQTQQGEEAPRPTQVNRMDDSDDDQLETEQPAFVSAIDDIRVAREFIDALKGASLGSKISKEGLSPEILSQIKMPKTSVLEINDPSSRLSLDLFLAVDTASEDVYEQVRSAIQRRFPTEKPLSYYKVKQLVEETTGISPILDDMCVDSCVGFTGPFSELETCPMCGQSRWEMQTKKGKRIRVARKQFHTIPIAAQLQALWRSKESALRLRYREQYTQKILKELTENNGVRKSPYTDFFDGSDYLEAYMDSRIKSGDMVLLLSLDGAQLYRNKLSDCWMYIWVIFDHSPDTRYKKRHVLPGGFIPGPNKPKNVDSFVFPGLYHLAAIQKEGIRIWDASRDVVFDSHPFLALATADGPGMACMNGFVGHQGRVHCRLYCPLVGRHKANAPQYYPVRLKPNNYHVDGCDHGDVDLQELLVNFTSDASSARYLENLNKVERSINPTDFKKRRLQTGICKPSIFLGLPSKHILGVPGCFPLDVMHLPALNIPDLFISLWRGMMDCDRTDNKSTWTWAVLKPNVWKEHGKAVAAATPYWPGSFDRPPRNIAEKLTSGYKAWEFLLYFYGLGPCLFFRLLPDAYWKNYCKLVRGFRILLQESISPDELTEAHAKLTEFSNEYELLYCERRSDRIHFVRPSIHTPSHLPHETERVGPGIIYSQWAMERTIGNLGEEIKQHSNPFANLAQRGLRRCQVNALKAMIPDIEPIEDAQPRGARNLGDSYYLLTAMDSVQRDVTPLEREAFGEYIGKSPHLPVPDTPITSVTRWARLRLPNRQVARSRWKEGEKRLDQLRCARNIKFKLTKQSPDRFAEVLYFAVITRKDVTEAVAVVTSYGDPDKTLLEMSSHTYYSVKHLRHDGVEVIPAKCIQSVVAMVPDKQYSQFKTNDEGIHLDRWQIVEKPGVKVIERVLEDSQQTEEELD